LNLPLHCHTRLKNYQWSLSISTFNINKHKAYPCIAIRDQGKVHHVCTESRPCAVQLGSEESLAVGAEGLEIQGEVDRASIGVSSQWASTLLVHLHVANYMHFPFLKLFEIDMPFMIYKCKSENNKFYELILINYKLFMKTEIVFFLKRMTYTQILFVNIIRL